MRATMRGTLSLAADLALVATILMAGPLLLILLIVLRVLVLGNMHVTGGTRLGRKSCHEYEGKSWNYEPFHHGFSC